MEVGGFTNQFRSGWDRDRYYRWPRRIFSGAEILIPSPPLARFRSPCCLRA